MGVQRLRRSRICGVSLLSVSVFFTSIAQVTIRETVTIDRGSFRPESQSQTLEVRFSYAGTLRQYDTRNPAVPPAPVHSFMTVDHRFCGIRPEDNTVYVDGGSGRWNGPASGGAWRICLALKPVGTGTATLDVFLDGGPAAHWTWTESCMSEWCESLPYFDLFLFNGMTIAASPASVSAGGETAIGLLPTYQWCASESYLLSDSVELFVVSGERYGGLRSADGTVARSAKAMLKDGDIQSVQFVACCTQPPPGGDSVVIEAAVRNVRQRIAFQVTGTPPLDHLVVDAPWYLMSGGAGTLRISGRDAGGGEVLCLPDSIVTLTIDSARYANFVTAVGDTVPSPLQVSYREARSGDMKLAANGEMPDATTLIHVLAATSGVPAASDSVSIIPPPGCIEIRVCPTALSPGDTAAIDVRDHKANGKVVPYPPTQKFFVGFIDPGDRVYGNLFDPAKPALGKSLDCVSQGFRFIAAADTAPPSGHVVRFNVLPRDESRCGWSAGMKAGGKLPGPAPSAAGSGKGVASADESSDGDLPLAGVVCVNEGVSIAMHEILLGETKYYQAKVCEATGSLVIDESVDPILTGGIAEDVWGSNPVEVVSAADPGEILGKRPGVYWEKEKPVPGKSGNLAKGLIRLVGRYWMQDSTYRVRLKTRYSAGHDGSLVIEVKKPGRLLTPGQTPTYRLSRDVFDKEYSVDELCIKYGGKYGIPPQMIKGQMCVESWPVNFQSDSGGSFSGFSPTYRYEPYTTQLRITEEDWFDNPFFVRVADMGFGPCVPNEQACFPDHQNVAIIDYPSSPKTVWDMILDHSQLEHDVPNEAQRLYGVRRTDNTMNFSPYSTIQAWYDRILDAFTNDESHDYSSQEAAESARVYMNIFLRDYWNGGAASMRAQTRIASSYGLLQPTYEQASSHGYDRDRRPEDLNTIEDNLTFSLRYQNRLLKQRIGQEYFRSSDWRDGFERTWATDVYKQWNAGRAGYDKDVLRRSKEFLPAPN